MSEQAQETAAPSEASADTQVEAKPEEKTYSQADLNKIAAKEKREGRTSERTAILEELGFEDFDDLKGSIEALRIIEEETQSESEKLTQEVEKLKGKLKESESHKERAERYKGAIESQLEARTKDLPEHITSLLSRIDDPLERYEWLTANEEHLRAPAPSRVPESPQPHQARRDPEQDEKARQEMQQRGVSRI